MNEEKTIKEILEDVGFVAVNAEKLKYNHKKQLDFWLDSGKFRLYCNNISVDNYLAISQKGDKFLAFSMCRESDSNNYTSAISASAYYLTREKVNAILQVLDIIAN